MTSKLALASLALWCMLLACACTEPADSLPDDSLAGAADNSETPKADEVIDTMNFDAFWSVFQAGIASRDAAAVADLVAFPLKDAQYLIGQPDNTTGIGRQELVDNFNLVFDEAARAKMASLIVSELETIELDANQYGIDRLEAAGRRFRVNYQEDDYESTVMYVFGKTPSGYRLIEINLAG